MNLKINIFTFLIFAYSILVCAIFKKEDNLKLTNTQTIQNKTNLHNVANKTTASNSTDFNNQNQ
ncbi:MAG: hypothetical protein UZ11_BCD004000534 [Bacteroidetes bacterium OLB11]|nr:MAG: hypothetical protein UZ11_BCD004000534 [Bacteroidetes bacterium OLB11]